MNLNSGIHQKDTVIPAREGEFEAVVYNGNLIGGGARPDHDHDVATSPIGIHGNQGTPISSTFRQIRIPPLLNANVNGMRMQGNGIVNPNSPFRKEKNISKGKSIFRWFKTLRGRSASKQVQKSFKSKPLKVGQWEVQNRGKERRSPTFYFLLTGSVLIVGTGVAIMLWIFVFSKQSTFKSPATQRTTLVLQNSTGTGAVGSQDGYIASFNAPSGVVTDADGNIYVSDTGNNEVRKINKTGFVSTLAGNASSLPSYQDGQGASARFNSPIGITFDRITGLVLVVDSRNSLIRQIDPNTGVVSTIAGNILLQTGTEDGQSTSASFNNPYGIAKDSIQNLYVSDTGNNLIRQVNSSRYVSTFAGVGAQSKHFSSTLATTFNSPLGIAVDSAGILYVVDSGNFQIVKIDTNTNSVSIILNLTSIRPAAIAIDKNNSLWVSQSDATDLQVVSEQGSIQTIPAPSTSLTFLAFDQTGNVVSSMSSLNVISVFIIVVLSSESSTSSFAPTIPESSSTMTTSVTDIAIDIQEGMPSSKSAVKITNTAITATLSTFTTNVPYSFNAALDSTPTSYSSSAMQSLSTTPTYSSASASIVNQSTQTFLMTESNGIDASIASSPSGTTTEISTSAVASSPVTSIGLQSSVILATSTAQLIVSTEKSVTSPLVYISTTFLSSVTYSTANVPIIRSSESSNFVSSTTSEVTMVITKYLTSTSQKQATTTIFTDLAISTRAPSIPSSLSWITSIQAGSVTAGNLFSTQPVLLLTDQYGDAISGASVSLFLYQDSACSTGAGSVGLTGNIVTSNSSGFAPFTAFNATTAGTYYVKAFYSGLNSSCSGQALTVAAATAYSISFTALPSSALRKTVFSPAPIVVAIDRYGNGVSTVTLASYSDSGCTSATSWSLFNSAATSVLSNGSFYFSSIYYSGYGTMYLKATSESISVCSSSIYIDVVVTTIAGSGGAAFANGTGAAASFNNPTDMVSDSSGNLYVADLYNSRIRMITAGGIVSTFAGSGSNNYVNGVGTGASFYYPIGIAMDATGTLFVADTYNHRIRKITTPGASVSLLAGSGTASFANGAGAAASFYYPAGIAVDSSGNIYVADQWNNRIRKITSVGVVSTLAGSGTAAFANGIGAAASFAYPSGISVDSSGTVYVADKYNHRIRKITSGGTVTTIAGSGSIAFADGVGALASFNYPNEVKVDSNGVLYVADQFNNRIRMISTGGSVSTLAGNGTAAFADGLGLLSAFYQPN